MLIAAIVIEPQEHVAAEASKSADDIARGRTDAAPAPIMTAEASVLASLAKLRTAPVDAETVAPAGVEGVRPDIAKIEFGNTQALIDDLASISSVQAGQARSQTASIEGTMANVAAAVAATVAAAERIALHKSTPAPVLPAPVRSEAAPVEATDDFPRRPAAAFRRLPAMAGPQAPKPESAVAQMSAIQEFTEIRFVSRPASPLTDAVPNAKSNPLADVPMPRPSPARLQQFKSGDVQLREWEEASVEIRRKDGSPPVGDKRHDIVAPPMSTRAGGALSRLVKSVTRVKT